MNNGVNTSILEALIVPRFLDYVKIHTTSDHHAASTPSTPGQWDLARRLERELQELGLRDVVLTDHCYVIAHIPATPGRETAPVIGFLAHIDTSSSASGENVRPQVLRNYDGKPVILQEGIVLDPAADPELAAQKGGDIIHTDGTTLLGADDKAGVAEIMAAVEYLTGHPEIPHGKIEIMFTPDEETGKGMDALPRGLMQASVCYTVDGGGLGELEIECFNACGVDLHFQGKAIHPGTARGLLINAAQMAACFAGMLPRSESPEATDGYYGYYCLTMIRGSHEEADAELVLRDFTREGLDRRVGAVELFARAVEAQFPGGKITVKITPQYRNMREKIGEHPEVLEKLKAAAERAGVSFVLKPIRGGTDGSRLSEMGIPTPNIFTGGHNFHSRAEWVSVSGMVAAGSVVIELARIWGE